ncbi:thioesterase family protein [Pseudomonas sp. JS3066]|uniref:acyl-CoA thioesterase n=1 Tax=unclassified Pseudomonas TaxID=196821 RepID=UPI000EA94B65|nr:MULTISPECIES: thioesterase family protein [unclassified Pseudomonas]AYF86268.1 acyl-CoA thioesterase [Pseudomonas sp. DY-1]MDH4653790.1 acyl-CoA thioesterase [Pseudomonas sp. BN606]MRK22736.1 acyl-CoA thioesterase [Pseudomonas sp. JG-B]WVK91106.1 thioesterase family protein [Pseudomonas sp. JS3066]
MPEKTLLHVAHIPVRWGDMDSYGHVNNTLYIQYLEEARVAWFESLGIAMNNVSQGPVVLQTLHTYLKPVVHPATVVIELYAGAVGKSSLVLEHRLSTLEAPATLYGEGHCKLVWIDHATDRSVPVPDDLRLAMGAGKRQ